MINIAIVSQNHHEYSHTASLVSIPDISLRLRKWTERAVSFQHRSKSPSDCHRYVGWFQQSGQAAFVNMAVRQSVPCSVEDNLQFTPTCVSMIYVCIFATVRLKDNGFMWLTMTCFNCMVEQWIFTDIRQLRLLLWKNMLMHTRNKVGLFVQIFIPLCLFFILAAVRTTRSPQEVDDTIYAAFALPSAGPLVFMQSIVCGGVPFSDPDADDEKTPIGAFIIMKIIN